MAKNTGSSKQVKGRAAPVKAAPAKKNERSVEEIEEDLQLPESSEEEEEDEEVEGEEESQEELSEESEEDDDEDDDEEVEGLSDDDDDEEEDEEEDAKIIEKLATTTGHKVNKVISKDQPSSGSAMANKKSKRGIIYIGRLPHGFQEEELKQYFQQFGHIINLKLSRNKKTGKSKHYAFIEFENVEVAKIAAETMNNYLLFGHLLKCEVIVDNEKDLFAGSDKKFKVIPWNKISKHNHDKPKSTKQWTKLVEKFDHQKSQKQKELTSKGIDFDLNSI